MQEGQLFEQKYNPPFYLHKINNYQKAVYQRKGHWTEKEKVKYGVFLEIYREKFQDRQNPILNKMFRVMSDFIKTRNHNQCRSHHQKMERERFEIDSILESIRSKYHPREYELFFEKYKKHIQVLNIESVLNEKGFTPHRNVQKRRKKQQLKNHNVNQKPQLLEKANLKGEYDSIIKINEPEHNINDISISQLEVRKEENKLTEEKIITENEPIVLLKKTQQVTSNIEQKCSNFQNQAPLKQVKNLKKTGLQYDSDSEGQQEKPQAFFVNIPSEIQHNTNQKTVHQNLRPNLFNQYESNFNNSQVPQNVNSFGTLNKFQSLPSQSFSIDSGQLVYRQNYSAMIRQYDQKKQWHLKEAQRLYGQMNDHLQQANLCEQMKAGILKQLMDFNTQFYYSSQFASSRF